MNLIESIFDNIGRAITSLAAVIFVMLMTITGMILFSHTLFNHVFPEGMQEWEKIAATWFMALGWEFTVLLTTCNIKHVHKHIPGVMAICSGIIVLFFIQAFDGTQSALTLMQRWFVGVLAATINWIYAELFYAKWQERSKALQLPTQLNELQSNVHELQSQVNQRDITINERDSALNEINIKFNEHKKELVELRRFKEKVQSELTCPYCKVIQDSPGTLNAHKGHCKQNPKNLTK